MRVTGKLTLAVSGVIVIVMATNAWIRILREVELFQADIRRDHQTLGRAIAGAVALAWQKNGETEAREVVDDANSREQQVLIRWVWLDARDGDPNGPDVAIADLGPVADGGSVVVTQRPKGADVDAIYTYVAVAGPRPGAIELRESLAEEERYVHQTIVWAWFDAVVLIVLCGLSVLMLGTILVGRPASKLMAHSRKVAAGDFAARLDLGRRDELGELAGEMNTMAERLGAARQRLVDETEARLAAVEQMRHADRLITAGKLATGIAHEVGTPLNVVIGHAQLITEEYPARSSAHENAVIISGQAQRVATIVRQMLDFARQRAPEKMVQDVVALVRQSASMLAALAKKSGVDIELSLPADEIRAPVDAGQLQQVLTNLVVNGIHAMVNGGILTMGAERVELQPPSDHGGSRGPYVRLFVRDHGTGIPPEVLSKIFDPFFTTKDVGEGTGLGLSVAHGIVKEHEGWLTVTTEVGKGSCFSVYLPTEQPS